MSRGEIKKAGVIRNPATAIAVGKCWTARWNGGAAARLAGMATGAFHPEECSFCDYEPDVLIEALEEFLEWSGIRAEDRRAPGSGMPPDLRAQVEGFLTLPSEEQERLVRKAQGYLE